MKLDGLNKKPDKKTINFEFKLSVMEYSSFIDLSSLSEDARKELESFLEYLVFKYQKIKKRKPKSQNTKPRFSAIQIDTRGFKFNRDEANER